MKTFRKWAAGFILSALTLSTFALADNPNSNGNGSSNASNIPADIVIVSHAAPTPEAPDKRILIAIRTQELAEHIQHGDFVVPYSDEIKGIIGWEDIGSGKR